ncbi:MAG: cell division protein FtsA [Alphaproteobacteria bacterium]
MRDGLVAALDIGSSKICCLIADISREGPPRVTGIGHQISSGVRNGVITDMDAVTHAITGAVHAAEEMAGETIDRVIVALTGCAPQSRTVTASLPITGDQVTDADIRRVLEAGRSRHNRDDEIVLHAVPRSFGIDGQFGISDPRDMYGSELSVEMHLCGAPASHVRTLQSCVRRAHLVMETPVAAGYAAGLACLVSDELELGVTLVDMGAGRTSFGVFFDGALVHADSVPVGGAHVTNDIAHGLSTPIGHAERMKTLYGAALPSPSDAQEVIDVPLVGEDGRRDGQQIPRAVVNTIIQPRMEETFELVRARIEHSGVANQAGRRVVLTGGASQLQGVRDLAGHVFDKQVRIGRPIGFAGLAETSGGPAFATVAGLIAYAARVQQEPVLQTVTKPHRAGLFGRLGLWLKESF